MTIASKVDIVAAAIEEAILESQLESDQNSRRRPHWSKELGVARNTMREAVRALAHAGVLSVRHGGGGCSTSWRRRR